MADRLPKSIGKRITFSCVCGKNLVAPESSIGRGYKCPNCGLFSIVTKTEDTSIPPLINKKMQPSHAADEGELRLEGFSKSTLFVLYSLIAIAGLTLVGFIFWTVQEAHVRNIKIAQTKLNDAIDSADSWVNGRSSDQGQDIEKRLLSAMENDLLPSKKDGENALARVRARTSELDRQKNILESQKQAMSQLAEAKKLTEIGKIPEAVDLLNHVLSNPYLIDKEEGNAILREIQSATSENEVLMDLVELPDEEFDRTKKTNKLEDGKVRIESLLKERKSTISRTIASAETERNKIKLENEKKKSIAERKDRIGTEIASYHGDIDGKCFSVSYNNQYAACIIKTGEVKRGGFTEAIRQIVIWDTKNGQEYLRIAAPNGLSIDDMWDASNCFSVNSNDFAFTASSSTPGMLDSFVVIVDISERKNVSIININEARLNKIALSNRHLVGVESTSGQHPVKVWDLRSSKLVGSFENHKKDINCLDISADGKYVATAGEDRIAIIWDIQSGEEKIVCDDHISSIETLAFSPDGRFLATGGFDCSVRLWDVSTGTVTSKWQLGTYDAKAELKFRTDSIADNLSAITSRQRGKPWRGPNAEWHFPTVKNINFSPDGTRLVVGLSTFLPQSIFGGTNPVLIDLIQKETIKLPSSFDAYPMKTVWAAFNTDGSAIVFERALSQRVRGENKMENYLSVVCIP